MATARTDPAYRRAFAFERDAYTQVAQRVVALPYGHAVRDDSLPRVLTANAVWALGAADVDAATLMRDADRVLDDVEHRWVVVEHEPLWRALEGAFHDAGWSNEVHVWMAHRGPAPELPPAAGAVREVSRAQIALAEERFGTGTEWGRDPEARRQIVAHHARIGDILDERYFAAFVGDEVAGFAKLRERDGVAQIEDVTILAPYRGRGLGRLVTVAATRAGLARDLALLFLIADDADWPKELYGRLGYEPVGRSANLVRRPS